MSDHRKGPIAALRGALTLALPILLLGAGTPDERQDATAAARRLEERLNGVTGLVAGFTQTLDSAALPSPQVERGTVYLLRPGRMRWAYDDPPGKLALADGRRTWLYLPDERRVVVTPMPGPGHGSGMALLLRERLDLLGEFTVAWGRPRAGDGVRPLVLTPRAPEEYDRILVEVDDEDLIRAFTVVDPLGGMVVYRFNAVRLEPKLDASLFRFVPPRGVEVQEVAP